MNTYNELQDRLSRIARLSYTLEDKYIENDGEVTEETETMEAEIAEAIRPFTVPKLVHWYSCGEHLEKYLAQDCYFTVGPDHRTNPAVQAVLRGAPPDRIMTETDGLEAVAWALGRAVRPEEIGDILRSELTAIARVHGISAYEAEDRVEENFERFWGGSGKGKF